MESNSVIDVPICVDLDGSLIATDTLLESILAAIKLKPLILLLLPFWILKGKVFLKNKIASIACVNPEALPYREEVLSFLIREKEQGRKLVLATATHHSIADSVANHLGIFSEVISTKDHLNLRGENKKKALESLYGERGFDYIGDSVIDIPVWNAAKNAIMVNPSSLLLNKVSKTANVNQVFKSGQNKFKLFIKEIRVHQWIKNILIFLPLILAHKVRNAELIIQTILAFFSFSFLASFVYLLNDMLDIEADRLHPSKKYRPLASGALSIKIAIATAPLLLILSLVLSFGFLPLYFTLTLLSYFALTTLYSFELKKIYIIDIFVLSILYTLRLVAGGTAVNVEISPWLLAFSMFMFLSLAIIKRYTELRVMQIQNKTRMKGRGYIVDDISLLRNLGTSSGYLSALVLVLYVHSNEVIQLYKRPQLLLPIAVLMLFWITRMWFFAHRGQMHDDPIVFTAKDPVSYIIGLILLLLAIGAAI